MTNENLRNSLRSNKLLVEHLEATAAAALGFDGKHI
jgi:hypothetical protein